MNINKQCAIDKFQPRHFAQSRLSQPHAKPWMGLYVPIIVFFDQKLQPTDHQIVVDVT